MKKVPNEDECGNMNVPCYYMPHHVVEKPSSTSTKLRVVFNASTKSTSGISLNDALKVGPTIQRDLFSILLTFRKSLYAFSADTTKMYRQVQVQENQRRLQRILWRFRESEPIGTYELATVTYGTTSAAFLAIRTLKQVALDEAHDYPEASAKVISDFYVDDLLSGSSSSLEHAIQLRKDISSLVSRGCFELRKWASNHPDIIADIEDDKVEKLDQVTTLGISWKPHEDIIVPFNKESIKLHNVLTKRSILSTISSLYDPIGLCAPVILTAKIFMQSLWSQQEINWDDLIPTSMLQGWNEFCQQQPLLSEIKITRCVLPVSENEMKEIQLHGFGDASEIGFGCCVYIRTTDNFCKTHIRLLCAKSRISPLKKTTIPRLELCAALLLAQLVQKITSILNIKFNRIFLWTDSEITLYRIKSTSTRFVTFVGNHIAQIQELTASADWHYVPSINNPADVVSRGLFPKQLKSCELWWNGPKFLNDAELTWPEQPRALNESEIPDLRRVEVSNIALGLPKVSFIEQFSDFKKLVRCLAIWLRYFDNLRCSTSKRRTDDIDAIEFSKATKRLVYLAQQEMFQEDLRLLQENKQVNKRHSKLGSLKPFLDTDGIIRVGGRLRNAEHIDFDQRFPMVILGKHHLATLLVRYEHIKNLHLGPQALLNQLRQRFWIISGRNLCKHTVRQCIACFRSKPITMEQLMGDLPKLRVQPARAFLVVGVDFCGPMFVTLKLRGKAPIKTYVAIFVCFSTKAVHMELVEDLSTESFLAAFRCFIARRGHPAHLFCDNATNFIGARNQLSEFYRLLKSEKHHHQVQKYCASEEIQFHFIPARSPHHGGIWEAAVKSAKGHLKRVIGASILTMAELRVLLAQTEACLNSRPISALSSDPSDYSALTPGHFLIGGPLTALVDPNLSQFKCNRLSRWQHVQQLAQHLWRRWSQEYLSSLQERAKWNKRKDNVEIGTLVLLKEENLPPQKWILGRVAAVFPDQDGLIRVVQVKTANGEFRRAISKICPLPLEGGMTCKGYPDDVGPRVQGGRHVTD